MYQKKTHIHFVGIGGIGMSGIAELLLNLGYTVSGSDIQSSSQTKRLAELGGTIYQGHDRAWGAGADVVVTSSAISEKNPEVLRAREAGIPVIMRAEMLAELMRLKKYGIAIAGSHGKTSTTSMVSCMLAAAHLDPTVVVGGRVDALGGNVKLGEGEFLVAEADESDGSFLKLSPVVEVITNIDLEHLDYYRDIEHIKETFLQFIEKIPFYGRAILCIDNAYIAEILPHIRKRTLTYGLTSRADVYAEDISYKNERVCCTVKDQSGRLGDISVVPPGLHSVYNALAAVCVGLELELDFREIQRGLESFAGVQRRMQKKGEVGGIEIVDDYGHHPTEIRTTLDAVKKAWPERRLVVLFQPHRYSRTKALFKEFQTCFDKADVLVLCDIYPASEEPIAGVSSKTLLESIRIEGQTAYIPDVTTMAKDVLPLLKKGDLLLTLGAGNIVQVGEELLDLIASRGLA
ncbi:MAG: UDP-N-acetylmuramate--L-alanine ligase [Deltaproteobacteria bacterium]|nr:MAG: UDP-N-acetylmuramate--L-alanine ligase [Deltaproteobacteria bacterium]PIE72965.1 MAG: UDP-N-acetylmuramate--L-alanine ligase [Deltaproteobacteria bacterium]